jgi:NADPH-dependent 2,4-dienoyl-CoA reductase/sulfur reductase-like enzyme/peroxiredoxin family protein/rhodanese-related sulfurtransferase/TusA-related sulfurtransferase
MKIVVVGGVAAGASVAARARRLDEFAEIIVLERSGNVSFANCGLPYHIGEIIKDRSKLLLQTPKSLNDSLAIDVRVSHEVLAIDPGARTVSVRNLVTGDEYVETWDKLALCPGSSPFRPTLPGIDHPDVMVLRNIEDMDAIKAKVDAIAAGAGRLKHAVVIGAGYIGLEMAENLHDRGLAVEIVELADQIMPPLDKELSTPMENYLRAHGIALHLGTAAAAFTPGKLPSTLTVELTSGRYLTTSLVILSAGVRPNTELAVAAGLELGPRGGIRVDRHMRTSHPDIYAAGDAVEVEHTVLDDRWIIPLAGPANRQARVAAENMIGRDTEYESTQGTSIVKVLDMVAGGTGATEKQLKSAGIAYLRAHVHPSGHAGYYPGTAQMDVKCLYSPDDGRILGAQITGFDGVDKRLDVFATAIRLGATVFDLEKLELAYAPPFGSAKDAVNMIGFIGANTLRGDLRSWFSTDYPGNCEGARIIDVRSRSEYDVWHIPGAELVPLPTLREAQAGWDRDTPIRLYCASGFRSYLAYRILAQRGFTDVATLAGGVKTFRAWHHVAPEDVPDPLVPLTSYAEEASLRAGGALSAPPGGTGVSVDLDCTGLACPGPIMALQDKMAQLEPGDEVVAHVSDIGFRLDAPAWAARNGHEVLDLQPEGPGVVARIRKGGAVATAGGTGGNPVAARLRDKKSFVVFSGDFDKVLAAFIIANGAAAMGDEVSMFFTFWGLNALRRPEAPPVEKTLVNKAFARMMPAGPEQMKLSQMHMLGGGTAMIKKIMRDNKVPSLPELIASAQRSGVRLVACTMTMDLLGLHEDELLDGVEFGGVAMFLGQANESNGAFFI